MNRNRNSPDHSPWPLPCYGSWLLDPGWRTSLQQIHVQYQGDLSMVVDENGRHVEGMNGGPDASNHDKTRKPAASAGCTVSMLSIGVLATDISLLRTIACIVTCSREMKHCLLFWMSMVVRLSLWFSISSRSLFIKTSFWSSARLKALSNPHQGHVVSKLKIWNQSAFNPYRNSAGKWC